MEKNLAILWFFLSLHMMVSCEEHKVYIVYLGEHNENRNAQEIEDHHHSLLHSIKGSKEEAKKSIVHSYKNIINGFSALLTPEEAAALKDNDEVISVFESKARRLHTTRSWDFTKILEADGDLSRVNGEALLHKANYGKDVIVGVFDTGVWPESESFNDEGMEPVPRSWKGICQEGFWFNSSHCNRKIIGARYYPKHYEQVTGKPVDNIEEFRSARDRFGHGTHTASTVGGRRVANVSSFGGFARGIASGGAPLVRLAIYKVCWRIPGVPNSDTACYDGDTLAGMDDAINDGVHVISASYGGDAENYADDAMLIGSLYSLKRNILVSCSAGNDGPTPSTVSHVAPWIITVAASSIDRDFPSPVILGNGVLVKGQTVTPSRKMEMLRLVYAADVEIPGKTTDLTRGTCTHGTLSPKLVKGKVVFCWNGADLEALEVKRAGGVAALFGQEVEKGMVEEPYLFPATDISYSDSGIILNYIRNNTKPTATLIPGRTAIGTKPAPFVAFFSSVGPNSIEGNILKPDITAPGLSILAAWTEATPVSEAPGDHRIVKYKIDSGTSMSCPHVSAVAALLKAIHPKWSSAAIRSAIMTTARTTNNMGMPMTNASGFEATPFEYGAGHIQPSKAADPGLVYDADFTDYLLFICSSTVNFLYPYFKCPDSVSSPTDLNYPSVAIDGLNGFATVKRTVTNVGSSNTSYSVKIKPPPGYSVKISPSTLHFSYIGEKKSFKIRVKEKPHLKNTDFSFGWFIWSDGTHMVRSPIVVSSA